MDIEWTRVLRTARAEPRPWALLSCPRCAGVVALDLILIPQGAQPEIVQQAREVVGMAEPCFGLGVVGLGAPVPRRVELSCAGCRPSRVRAGRVPDEPTQRDAR